MLRFRHKMRPQRLALPTFSGPEERIQTLRQMVSGLIRYERIEPSYHNASEARQYAERLIYLAVKNGDRHRPTMELADYWLLEKDLVHKLFKVLVPRYEKHRTSYTNLHRQAIEYPGDGKPFGVLELKGNPYPPVKPHKRDVKYLLSNVLLSAARRDFYHSKQQEQQTQPQISSSEESATHTSSSVDPVSSSVDPVSENLSSVDPAPSDGGHKG